MQFGGRPLLKIDMCRITGIISKRFASFELVQKVTLMSDSLKHGGPDDHGLYVNENAGIVFGHRRLSLIDISSNGHQPMADPEKKVWITFNGEIYNFLELKKELSNSGIVFFSQSDTEVIIQAYLKWGTNAFAKFRGMFAFALYDANIKKTYLVRDTIGVKPLYYFVKDGLLSFASEVRAFKISGVTNNVNESWKVRFLAYGHIPEPFTTLQDVFSLQKGHFLEWNHLNETYKIEPYAIKGQDQAYITDIKIANERLRDTLIQSVKKQLIADAPIGVFLSGGIDSSLITLLAAQQKEQDLKTVSIYFDEKSYNERHFQKIISSKIAGDKYEHLVKNQDFNTYFPQIIKDMDMPTTDGINTWFISKFSHEMGLKAVLSGLGADELLGGYPSFNRIKYIKYLRKLPLAVLKAGDFFKDARYRRLSFLSNNHPLSDYLFLRGLFIPENIARILDMDLKQVDELLFESQPKKEIGKYDEEHAAWFETNVYMQNQLLRDTDVMSMCHGLEVRVPFLDEDFQNVANSISPAIRFNDKQPKKILIDSFNDLIPTEIWKRPKMGFTFPLQDWMRNSNDLFNENNFKGKIVKNLIKEFNDGQSHWSKVFALYQIQSYE